MSAVKAYLAYSPRWGNGLDQRVPQHMQEQMCAWIMYGRRPGGFLTALLQNDLMKAFERADDTNARAMQDYTVFLYNYTPAECWGSVAEFAAWKGLTPDAA